MDMHYSLIFFLTRSMFGTRARLSFSSLELVGVSSRTRHISLAEIKLKHICGITQVYLGPRQKVLFCSVFLV